MSADPSFITAGTIAVDESGGGIATSLAVPLASTTTGDLNIVVLTASSGATNVDPGLPTINGVAIATAGWTTIQSIVDTSATANMPRSTVVYRVRQAGDATSITFAWATASNVVGRAYAYSSGTFDPSAPVPSSVGLAQSPSSTSFAAPALTTSVRGAVFGTYFCRTSGTWTPPDTSRGGAPAASAAAANFSTSESAAVNAGTYTKTGVFSVATSVGGAIAFLVASNPSTPPVAAFTLSQVGLALTVDGSTSTATGPATITSYAWDYGDGGTATGATPAAHTYATAGTYTVSLTVTDSNSQTNTVTHTTTAVNVSATGTVQSVSVGTNWTASSGTQLSALTDGDPTTFITSLAPPTAQEFDFVLSAMSPPSTGQPLKVFLTIDAPLSTTATLAAQLFDGATQRSALTGVTIPVGSGGSVVGSVVLTFPWSDVSAVSTGGWNALKVKLQVTAS